MNVIKLVNGLTAAEVKDGTCPNGIGAIDATVVDRDTLDIKVYCLTDRPPPGGGSLTLVGVTGSPATTGTAGATPGTMTLPTVPISPAPCGPSTAPVH